MFDRNKEERMKFRILRFIAILGFALLFFIVMNAYLNQVYVQEQEASGTGASLITEDGWLDVEKLSHQNAEGRVVDSELFFLLLGVDQNDGESSSFTRTDTMMLVKVDFEKNTIDLLSLPRDSRVKVEGVYTKLNHAHSIGGIRLTMDSIRDWLNIDLDYFVEVDFEAVVNMVDAIGGIHYDVPDIGMDYQYERQDSQVDYISPGPQKLDGEQALGYLRYRKGYVQGDIGRVEAQQQFLKSVVEQIFKGAGIQQLPAYIKTVMGDVRTNIPWDEMIGLAGRVNELRGVEMTTHTVPGEGVYIDGISYYEVDAHKTERLIEDLLPNYVLLDLQ
jgi:LCP family protein required for cell wall assembly